MANNHSIQLLRKNGTPTSTELNNLLPGQPLFDMNNNKLYIGKGNGDYTSFNNIGPQGPKGDKGDKGDTGPGYTKFKTIFMDVGQINDKIVSLNGGGYAHYLTIRTSAENCNAIIYTTLINNSGLELTNFSKFQNAFLIAVGPNHILSCTGKYDDLYPTRSYPVVGIFDGDGTNIQVRIIS